MLLDRQILWDDEDWLDDVNVKLIGMVRAIRAFLPHFATDGSGRSINVGGIAGVMELEKAMTHGINNSANAIVFLASDRARYINGTHLVVDGDMSVNSR